MSNIDTKQRLFEVMGMIDDTFSSQNVINETKAFGQLRKLNKILYDDVINLEKTLGKDVLKLIDDSIENSKLKFNNDEERELTYLIILDLILSRYLDKNK